MTRKSANQKGKAMRRKDAIIDSMGFTGTACQQIGNNVKTIDYNKS